MLLVAKPRPHQNTFDLGATAKCLHRPGCIRIPYHLPRKVNISFEERKKALPWKDGRVQQTEMSVIRPTQLSFAPAAHKAQAVVEANLSQGRILIRMQMECPGIREYVTTTTRYVAT